MLTAGSWVELQPPARLRAAWGWGCNREASVIGSVSPARALASGFVLPLQGSPWDVCGVQPAPDPCVGGATVRDGCLSLPSGTSGASLGSEDRW